MGIVQAMPPEDWTAFIAMMQLGTAAAVVIYFFNDYLNIGKGILNDYKNRRLFSFGSWSTESRLALYIIIGTLPVAIIGLLFHDFIEGTFTKETGVIATSLIVLALLLAAAEKIGSRKRNESQATWIDAIFVGIAQAIALIPGSSRSGTTITAGLFLGLNRETAARFSFHLSVPAILASGAYQMYQARTHISDIPIMPLMVSILVSGVVGYLSISFLLHYLQKHSTLIFIVYRIVLGILLWLLIFAGIM
jgi:undecaprenyl-diphosphatase